MDTDLAEVAVSSVGRVLKGIARWILSAVRFVRIMTPRDRRDRRRSHDRRIHGPEHRMQHGLWNQFHERTGLGKMQALKLDSQRRSQLFDAAVTEADRYEFTPRGSTAPLPSSAAVQSVLEPACLHWQSLPKLAQRAEALTELVARHLLAQYNVRMLDRRQQQRRAASSGG